MIMMSNYDRIQSREGRFRLALLSLAGALLLAIAWLGTAVPAAETAPACTTNPFGSSYDLFGEGEIFVGYMSGGFVGNHLSAFTMELEPNPVDKMLLEQQLFIEETEVWGNDIEWQTAVAADLDGDGHTEMLQSFVTGNGAAPGYYEATYDHQNSVTYTKLSDNKHRNLAAASGNILGADSEVQQAVLASVNEDTGAVTVVIWDGNQVLGVWRNSNDYGNPATVDVAVGNINNDPQDDIILAMHDGGGGIDVVVLTFDEGYNSGSGSNVADNLKVLGKNGFSTGTPIDVQVAPVRINGDFQDEIVVVADTYSVDTEGYSSQLKLRVLAYNPTAQDKIVRWDDLEAEIDAETSNFALAAGDVNGQAVDETGVSPEEIVLAFYTNGPNYPFGSGFAVEAWRAEGLDTPAPVLARGEQWITDSEDRDQAEYLSLQTADLNNDGRKEMVVALDDGRGLEVSYATYEDLVADPADFPWGQSIDLDPTDLYGRTAVAVGDRNNDAVKAVATAECKQIQEQQIVAVGFAPPHWGVIQDTVTKGAAMGQTVSSETMTTTALTYYRSDTVSGYVGAAVGGSLGPANVEVSARVTAAETKSRSSTEGGTTGTGKSLEIQNYSYDDFLLYSESFYNCYAYTLEQNGATIPESSLRNCDFVNSSQSAIDLDNWDSTLGAFPGGVNQALTWTPVVRDWASLGLFRGAYTAQSSTSGGEEAARAVDGTLLSSPANDSVATTMAETNPWWQIDLGNVEPISKVRLWNRTDWLECADLNACPNQLDHIYILISETDFRTMAEEGDPAALMARPDVYTFSLADLSGLLNQTSAADPLGKVTTFLTLDGGSPVQGQFVRVQRVVNNGPLSLGEVQIFGTNHVDPHRYPLQVREKGTTEDGVFEVQLYNPQGTDVATTWPWVEVRGNLIWNETSYANGVLNGRKVSLGGTGLNWAYSTYSTAGSFATNSLSHETSVGVEFDYTSGVIFQMQAGYGEEFTTGTTSEFTTETSWTNEVDFGGKVENFPNEYGQQVWDWAQNCQYEMRPYQYELIETSSFGQETRYTVLDYIVPEGSPFMDQYGGESFGLDRTDSEAMANCHNGNVTGNTPQTSNDQFSAYPNGSATFNVVANDTGNNLRITGTTQPQNGNVSFTEYSITYTPDEGFTGKDTFTYTISDGTTTSEGTVTVEVAPAQLFLPTINRLGG